MESLQNIQRRKLRLDIYSAICLLFSRYSCSSSESEYTRSWLGIHSEFGVPFSRYSCSSSKSEYTCSKSRSFGSLLCFLHCSAWLSSFSFFLFWLFGGVTGDRSFSESDHSRSCTTWIFRSIFRFLLSWYFSSFSESEQKRSSFKSFDFFFCFLHFWYPSFSSDSGTRSFSSSSDDRCFSGIIHTC